MRIDTKTGRNISPCWPNLEYPLPHATMVLKRFAAPLISTGIRLGTQAGTLFAMDSGTEGAAFVNHAEICRQSQRVQGRFGSVVMDEEHLAHAVRHVSLHPVRAELVEQPEDWRWSSISNHLSGQDNELVKVAPVLERYGYFANFLGEEESSSDAFRRLRQSETTGRPLGLKSFPH